MAVFDRIKDVFKRKRMQKRLDTVKNAYEEPETERESIKKATEIVVKLIEENPNMSAVELLKKIQEEEDLPNKILVETTKQLPEVRSENATVTAVEELDISSQGIQEILEHVDVSTEAAEKMVEQIPDEEIKAKEMKKVLEQKKRAREEKRKREEERKRKQTEEYKKQLKRLYTKSDKKNTIELVEELKEIRQENDSEELLNIIKQVLARRTAIEYKQFGSARIPTMTKVISAEEMLEFDFPKLVKEEFEDIKDVKNYPGNRDFSEETLRQQILTEIAKNVAIIYEEIGSIDIPQSKTMSEISSEEEEFLINQLRTHNVEIEDLDKIHRRIRGIKEYDENDVINMFRKMDEDEKEHYVKEMKRQIIERKQNKFNPKVEEKVIYLRKIMQGLEQEEVIDVLDDAIESAEYLKKSNKTKEKEEGQSTR